MLRYLITIVMPDGSSGRHQGLYAHGVDAIVTALDWFPSAKRISVRRVG